MSSGPKHSAQAPLAPSSYLCPHSRQSRPMALPNRDGVLVVAEIVMGAGASLVICPVFCPADPGIRRPELAPSRDDLTATSAARPAPAAGAAASVTRHARTSS